jgi:DNA/RNA-binding domain of Phe-tRNA-synthetase-like protein
VAFRLTIDGEVQDLALGLVEVSGAFIGPAGDELRRYCGRVVMAARENADAGEPRRQAVRQLLRYGGFKPSGRSKPAQEYLLRSAVQDGALPAISNVVDAINAVSLASGLPISLISLDRCGRELTVRYGRDGERYVFNRAGQELDVKGLLCLCAAAGAAPEGEPVGSPVKDSMRAKVDETDRHLLACVYAPRSAVSAAELRDWSQRLADGFRVWCSAEACTVSLSPESW